MHLSSVFDLFINITFRLIRRYWLSSIHYNHTGRIALCCIAKMENEYIREFVEYYLALGFDHIYIYDNNDVNGEVFSDVINDFILGRKCTIINYRGKHKCQIEAYDNCYRTYSSEYEWMAFFDCDEFLTFTDEKETIHSYLDNHIFAPFQVIYFNWLVYGDNEFLDTDGRNVTDRLVSPVIPYDFHGALDIPENNHVKTIIRGGLKHINWNQSCCGSHSPASKYYRYCNALGVEYPSNIALVPYDFSKAFVRHYSTKTIGEYVRNKKKRGFPDIPVSDWSKILTLDFFFRYNQRTKEKEEYANKIMHQL